MKKLNLLFVAFFAITTAFVTSCKPEPAAVAEPEVTISSGDVTVMAGTEVKIIYSVKAEGELEKISFLKGDAGYGTPITKDFDSKTAHADTVVIPGNDVTETFDFEVLVEDKEGQSRKAGVTITIDDQITEHTVTLGDQNDTPASFIDLANAVVYKASEATENQANIDLLHYWGNSGNASIYSVAGAVEAGINHFDAGLDMSSWSSPNTLFISGAGADYDAVDYASLTSGAANAELEGMTNLATGDLIYFKTEAGLSGLIKVGDVSENKLITDMTYKIQDVAPSTK